jgi:hypothetical protein
MSAALLGMSFSMNRNVLRPGWLFLHLFVFQSHEAPAPLSSSASATRTCYSNNGTATNDLPCNGGTSKVDSLCCPDGFACYSTGMCLDMRNNTTFGELASCTDVKWNVDTCPRIFCAGLFSCLILASGLAALGSVLIHPPRT